MITIKTAGVSENTIPMTEMENGDTGIVTNSDSDSRGMLFLKTAKGFISLNNPSFYDTSSLHTFKVRDLRVRLVDIDIIVGDKMITWHIGKKIEVKEITNEHRKYHKDTKCAFLIEYFNGTEQGYEEHSTEVGFYDDDSISLGRDDGGGSFIYLYPEEVKELKKLLEAI